MKYPVHTFEVRRDTIKIGNVFADNRKSSRTRQMAQIILSSGDEIIENNHFMTIFNEPFG